MKQIKLVATDLDGTLLGSDRKISENTKQVLQQLIKQGVKVVPLSGRPRSSIKEVFPGIDLEYLIGYNGGLIQKMDGTIIHQSTFSEEQIDFLLSLNHPFAKGPYLLGANHFYLPKKVSKFQRELCETMWKMKSRQLTPADHHKIIKCEYHGPRIFGAHFFKVIKPQLEPYFDVTSSGGWTLEMTNHDATKGNALEILRKKLGLNPSEVVVFGDNLNDVSAFRVPGITKVAMGNAIDEIKDLADDVTLTDDQDGVAEFLKQYCN